MQKFKNGDQVMVMAGKNKGKKTKIIGINVEKQKVTLEKCGLLKKHMKATQKSRGGIIEVPGWIHWSNVKVICPKTNKPSRVGFKIVKDKLVRIAKVSGEVIN